MNLKEIDLRLSHIERLLLCNKTVLTLNEAAEYTGLSKSHLYKLTSSGLIPHSKPNGKQCYFAKNELDIWLMRNRIKTNEEQEADAVNYVVTSKYRR